MEMEQISKEEAEQDVDPDKMLFTIYSEFIDIEHGCSYSFYVNKKYFGEDLEFIDEIGVKIRDFIKELLVEYGVLMDSSKKVH